MRKFLVKTLMMVIVSALSLAAGYYALFLLRGARADPVVPYVIAKAGNFSGKPSVIFGDSVCAQFWPARNDSPNICHLSSNQAITTAGNYLLLKKYLEHNQQTKNVYYLIKPQSLCNDMDLYLTYQYFVIPFFNDDWKKFIDDETKQDVYSKFGKFFCESDYIKCVLSYNKLLKEKYLSCILCASGLIVDNSAGYYIQKRSLSRTAIIYLKKMNELCTEYGAIFHVLPLPLRNKADSYGWDKFADDVKLNGLENIIGSFVQNINYYPDSWFSDGVHFKKEILDAHSDDIRASVMK